MQKVRLLLVDDSPHHQEAAAKHGLADRYVVVPVYGGQRMQPTHWPGCADRKGGGAG